MKRWMSLALPAALLLGLLVVLAQRPIAAQSQTGEQTYSSLQGQTVGVFFGERPHSAGRDIVQLQGRVSAVNEHGMWLTTEHRAFVNKREEKYAASVYIPWSAVGYVRVAPK